MWEKICLVFFQVSKEKKERMVEDKNDVGLVLIGRDLPPSGENEVKIRRELRDLSTKKEGDKL